MRVRLLERLLPFLFFMYADAIILAINIEQPNACLTLCYENIILFKMDYYAEQM